MERRKDALAFIIDFEAFVVNALISKISIFGSLTVASLFASSILNFYLQKINPAFYNAKS